jgi:hypothetical protein
MSDVSVWTAGFEGFEGFVLPGAMEFGMLKSGREWATQPANPSNPALAIRGNTKTGEQPFS